MPSRILILDDDADFNHLLTDIFSQADYEVTSQMDPVKALERFRQEPFDLVVTDQKMPGMSGESFIKEVKQVQPSVPVIMVSGYLDNDTIRSLIREGVGGVFLKPLNVFSLLKRTAAILEQAASEAGGEPSGGGDMGATDFQHNLGFPFQSFPCRSRTSADFARRFHGLRAFKSNLVIIGEPGTPFASLAQDLVNFSDPDSDEFFFIDRESCDAETIQASILEAQKEGDKRITLVLLDTRILHGGEKDLVASIAKKEGIFEGIREAPRLVFCLHEEVDTLYDQGIIDDQLYLLIGTSEIRVPALREMKDDIPMLAQAYAALVAEERGLSGVPTIEAPAMDFLRSQEWAGNCGELQDIITQALAASDGATLRLADFQGGTNDGVPVAPALETVTDLKAHLEAYRRDYTAAVLLLQGGDRDRARDTLDIEGELLETLLEGSRDASPS
jgi:DNA-binding NtrC family response regulator